MWLTKHSNPRIVSYHFSASADRHCVLHCQGAADDRTHLQERPGGAVCGMYSGVSLCTYRCFASVVCSYLFPFNSHLSVFSLRLIAGLCHPVSDLPFISNCLPISPPPPPPPKTAFYVVDGGFD